MYRQENGSEIWNVEKCCFEQSHIALVQKKLEESINQLFKRYCGGGVDVLIEKLVSVECDLKDIAAHVAKRAEDQYLSDSPTYNGLFTKERMDEESYDYDTFKRTLRNKCPIIHQTLYSKQKGLEKFQRKFNEADAKDLWEKINNIINFAYDYKGEEDENKYMSVSNYEDLGLSKLDTDDCSLSGVIGGGIKSLISYMRNPQWFPSRSRNAIWALYFLADKESFGCTMESEFIMINLKDCQMSQNYFYPYVLFSYYALVTYRVLKERFNALGVSLNPKYRYAYVDSFFEFVAIENEAAIKTLQSKLSEDYV